MPQGEVGEGKRRDQEERHSVGMRRGGVDEVHSEGGVVEIRKGYGGAELGERAVERAFCLAPGVFLEPKQELHVSIVSRAIFSFF